MNLIEPSKPNRPIVDRPILSQIWAAFGLVLIAVTWPLWFPVLSTSDYPSIGLGFRADFASKSIVLTGLSLLLCAGLLVVLVAPGKRRPVWGWIAASLWFSFLLDQHRLQPWAYQLALYALVFASMGPRRSRRLLIPLAASIYLYSAVGKFDYQFVHTVGQDFLTTLARPIGGLPETWQASTWARLALIFPVSELMLGIGLLFRRARPVAGVGVMAMHAALIMILGPWGLDQSSGVLVWNAALLVQAYVLMVSPGWSKSHVPAGEDSLRCIRLLSPLATLVLGIALVAPLAERRGYWDHWLSWSLYSPHTSRVTIEVHRSSLQRLPDSLSGYLDEDPDGQRWHQVDAAGWSLGTRLVPIYPQSRYQLALADNLARQYGIEPDAIRVRVRSVSDRWTGQRDEDFLMGTDEIRQASAAFWF